MDTEDSAERSSLLKEKTRVPEVVHAEGTADEYSETTLQSTVPSVEESSTGALVPSLNAQLSENNDKIEVNASGDDDVGGATKSDAEMLRSVKNQTFVGAEQKTTLKTEEMLSTLRPMHVRVLNRDQGHKSNAQLEQSGRKKSDEFVRPEVEPFVEDEEEQLYVQGLIDQATHFESFRIFPKKPVPFPIRNSKQREEEVPVGKAAFVAPGKAILNRGYHSAASFKLPSIPKSVPEKIGDPLERKTSLGVAVTLDEASTRATNENTSPTRRLDDGDILVRHLSDPEDQENIKRVARSHALETDSNDFSDFSKIINRTSSPIAENEMTEIGAIRRFKRPPRILPTRNLQSQGFDSSKYVSSKERARSLFQKSNETRRKQVSFIINRNESNTKKLNSSDSDFPSMEKVENDDRIMQVEATRLR